jgi:single-stranded DNA-binding protein
MSRCVNTLMLLGNCGKDPEFRYSPCDHALGSPNYFEPDDPGWQAEEADNAHS